MFQVLIYFQVFHIDFVVGLTKDHTYFVINSFLLIIDKLKSLPINPTTHVLDELRQLYILLNYIKKKSFGELRTDCETEI